jgi:hypothetical protein
VRFDLLVSKHRVTSRRLRRTAAGIKEDSKRQRAVATPTRLARPELDAITAEWETLREAQQFIELPSENIMSQLEGR